MNDLISRKEFFSKTIKSIGVLGFFLLLKKSSKNPILVSDKKPFVKGSPRLFHQWFCHNFFDFNQVFNDSEKRFSYLCMDLMDDWSYEMAPSLYFSMISYSHKIMNGSVNSTRLALGSLTHQAKIHNDLVRTIESKGINPSSIPGLEFSCGLGWDIAESLFKIYMFYPNLDQLADPEIKSLLKFSGKENLLNSFGLVSYSFKGEDVYEKKVYSTFKNSFSLSNTSKEPLNITWMMTTKRGLVQQFDVSDPSYYYKKINKKGQAIIDLHKRQGFELDSIAMKNADEFTLYF